MNYSLKGICMIIVINKICNKIKRDFVRLFLYRIIKIDNYKVVVFNFFGKGYGDNPKYIVEKLLLSDRKLDIVWIVKDLSEEMPANIRKVKYGSWQSMYELATAKVIIGNIKNFSKPKKKTGQFYLQTWHGGIGLKESERQIEKKLSVGYVKKSKKDAAETDLMLSDSNWTTEIYANWFWYRGPIYKSGFPRNDILIKRPQIALDHVYKYFGLEKKKKIVLYAPTFRDGDNPKNIYQFDFETIAKSIEKKFGSEHVVLIRLHPNLENIFPDPLYDFDGHNIFNAQDYPDMQELLVATDIFITDYSSAMFDAMLANCKVFLLAKDLDSFNGQRKFLFNIKKDLPFDFSESEGGLNLAISNFDEQRYRHAVRKFADRLQIFEDGNASDRVAKLIIDKMGI
ncbi:UNVERIFIED_CONTAM: CDP-glycerol--glycerophosphate glycerophosphotransferase [Limosilactobacillus fermentum]|nr:CDP-glycerol--glycerophosphate glycerophosphotransferase [Limosilactobacillus fermentum]